MSAPAIVTPIRGGPRTAAGKRRSSLNALRVDGIFSRRAVLPGESEADYATLVRATIAELGAETVLERMMAERLALALWRTRRVMAFEARSLAALERRVDLAREKRDAAAENVELIDRFTDGDSAVLNVATGSKVTPRDLTDTVKALERLGVPLFSDRLEEMMSSPAAALSGVAVRRVLKSCRSGLREDPWPDRRQVRGWLEDAYVTAVRVLRKLEKDLSEREDSLVEAETAALLLPESTATRFYDAEARVERSVMRALRDYQALTGAGAPQ